MYESLFANLQAIFEKPEPYSRYTAEQLWNDPYISKTMMQLHLNQEEMAASRPKDFMDKSLQWMINHFQLAAGKRVCDFGCGPGLYTTELAKTGAEVTGIDFSERSIRYAKNTAAEQNLSINYLCQDYLNLSFKPKNKFDLITMIFCDYTSLSNDQRSQLLTTFYEFCADDGYIILDVFSLNYYQQLKEMFSLDHSSDKDIWSCFWSDKFYYVFKHVFKYDDRNLGLSKYVIVEQDRTRQIYHWSQCFDLPTITKELADNGFQVVEQYASVAGDPLQADSKEYALVAKKIPQARR